MFFVAEGQHGLIVRNTVFFSRLHGAAHHVRVPANNGTVVGVGGRLELFPVLDNHRVEDTVDSLIHEREDMAVHQLSGEADVVRHDATDPFLIEGGVRFGGEHHFDATLREKGMPEGVMLENIQYPGNADS